MKKNEEFLNMAPRCHNGKDGKLKELFTQASEEARVAFRDAYLAYTGMSYPSFYQKLADAKFRPLEIVAFFQVMRTHPLK